MADDQDKLTKLGERLTRERPLPSPRFRSSARRRLLSANRPRRPAQLRALILGYALAGSLLLALAGLGLAGAGPFAAG
jgi:hypothetical protein